LEKKYPDQVVVIGIHSPKFETEKDPASIKKAMARYERNQPVLNDANRVLWTAYNVQAWPTIVLIDPVGRIALTLNEEHCYEPLSRAVSQLIRLHRPQGTLSETRLRAATGKDIDPASSPLYFPGKVLADDVGARLFVADSTHHRIVVSDMDGKVQAVVGTGQPGRVDGPFAKAAFHDPQGMAVHGNTLYVADRGNHVIRALDLKAKTVKTVAGSGFQGRGGPRAGGPALRVALNSPWDVLLHEGTLYIAMAGDHQIWTLDLAGKRVAPFAGNGWEELKNGPPAAACFAQPSGLSTDGKNLYVADSEDSGIRAVPLDGRGLVTTLVGAGLFDFNDIDGPLATARLQHAIGVQCVDGKIFVADTYNNKIKVIDPMRGTCTTFVGGDGQFNEPAGLSAAYGKLYVADTNAHRIRVVDLKSRAVSTLELKGLKPPSPPAAAVKKSSRGR
jgi:DNA-binding beta-propeller fold protein YncE